MLSNNSSEGGDPSVEGDILKKRSSTSLCFVSTTFLFIIRGQLCGGSQVVPVVSQPVYNHQ